MKINDILYRYGKEVQISILPILNSYYYDVTLKLISYKILKKTPKGFWIEEITKFMPERRWMSNEARNPYAFSSKKKALDDFERRIKWHMNKLENKLKIASNTLIEIKNKKDEIGN